MLDLDATEQAIRDTQHAIAVSRRLIVYLKDMTGETQELLAHSRHVLDNRSVTPINNGRLSREAQSDGGFVVGATV